jgi:hypothetical protein
VRLYTINICVMLLLLYTVYMCHYYYEWICPHDG